VETPTLMETLILQYSCSTYDHFSSPMFLSLPLDINGKGYLSLELLPYLHAFVLSHVSVLMFLSKFLFSFLISITKSDYP
jgi:hypothetical protein